MVKNPMENQEIYSGSTELSKNSETVNISVKLVNSLSNGNLVFEFYYEGFDLVVEEININDITASIINININPSGTMTRVVINPNHAYIPGEINHIDMVFTIVTSSCSTTLSSEGWDLDGKGTDNVVEEMELVVEELISRPDPNL